MTHSKISQYACSESAIRREIDAALRKKRKREADEHKQKFENQKSNKPVRVSALVLPDKTTRFEKGVTALQKLVANWFEELVDFVKTPRNELSKVNAALQIVEGRAAGKTADNNNRLYITHQLIEEMWLREQDLRGKVSRTNLAAEVLKKRATRKKKAKDLKASELTTRSAEVATHDLDEFLKVKAIRLPILQKLNGEYNSQVHGRNALLHTELTKAKMDLMLAAGEHAIAHSQDVALAAAKRVKNVELSLPEIPSVVVLNEEIFAPFEAKVKLLEKLSRESAEAIANMPPVDLETLSEKELLAFSIVIDSALKQFESAGVDADVASNSIKAELAKYETHVETWRKRQALALDSSNDQLAQQALSRAEQYEEAVKRVKELLEHVLADPHKASDNFAKLQRARKLVDERLKASSGYAAK